MGKIMKRKTFEDFRIQRNIKHKECAMCSDLHHGFHANDKYIEAMLNHEVCKSCEMRVEIMNDLDRTLRATQAKLDKAVEALEFAQGLIDDLKTPSRLGLGGPVNPEWKNLNSLEKCLKEIEKNK
jgi:hypothetical protein